MEHELFHSAVPVLAITAVLVAGSAALRLSPIIGYLVSGLLVGPWGFGLLTAEATLATLAELGVVMLMFTIGLEFSLPRLIAAKRLVLGLGSLQVLLIGGIAGAIIYWLWQPSWFVAALLGGAIALSSTAIVLKQLAESFQLGEPHGQATHAILIFQDLAAVFLLAFVGVVTSGEQGLPLAIALVLAKIAGLLAVLIFVGRRLLPPLLERIAATRSLELFMLVSLLMAIAAASVADSIGLSPTIGAFAAGMLLGETRFRLQVEADIRPFRDLMLGLFFITIGMQLNVVAIASTGYTFALLVALLIVLKPLLIIPLVRVFGFDSQVARRTAISLGQGGEFGLLIVSLLAAGAMLNDDQAQPLLAAIIFSMFLGPLFIQHNKKIGSCFTDQSKPDSDESTESQISEIAQDYEGHVIVCGYGRMGQNLVRILEEHGYPVIALDIDKERVFSSISMGAPVVFGNAKQPGVLAAAGLMRARVVALTMGDIHSALHISHCVRAQRKDVPILVRSKEGRNDELLQSVDVTVYPEGLETSLSYTAQVLHFLGMPASKVDKILNSIRAQDYADIRSFIHDSASEPAGKEGENYPLHRRVIVLDEEHYAVGRKGQDLAGYEADVILDSVRRNGVLVSGNLMDVRMKAGDVLVLTGPAVELEQALHRLHFGH